MPAPVCSAQTGSTLVTALLTVTVLSIVAANVLLSISSRYNSAYRSGSWNEALITAESGVDTTVSELLRALPDVRAVTSGVGTGFSQPSLGLVTGLQISPNGLVTGGTLTNVQLPQLIHGGEGSTVQQARISVNVVPLSNLLNGGSQNPLNSLNAFLNGNPLNLIQIRSRGTVLLTGGTVAGPTRPDNELWRVSLLTDRFTGAALTQATVSREIEVILRPVFAFESAVSSDGVLLAGDPNTVFDSFNSTSLTASTNGQYDSYKRQANATTRSNGATVTLGGKVWGNVDTNGGNVVQDPAHVTGTVNNNTATPLPPCAAPTWTGSPLAPSSVTGNTTLPAGPVVLPGQYRFTTITGNLHITAGLAGLGTNVEICVDGDVTGSIEIDPNITAKVYVAGSLVTDAAKLKNDSGHAANLQIYGVPADTAGAPAINLNLNAALAAVVYAPRHAVNLKGTGDFSGSIVAGSFQTNGPTRIHYDESLAFTAGPLVGYQIASWKELTN